MSLALKPSTPFAIEKITVAPANAPMICPTMYAGTVRVGTLRVIHIANVTAGLMWHPEIGPTVYAAMSSESPNAVAIPAT